MKKFNGLKVDIKKETNLRPVPIVLIACTAAPVSIIPSSTGLSIVGPTIVVSAVATTATVSVVASSAIVTVTHPATPVSSVSVAPSAVTVPATSKVTASVTCNRIVIQPFHEHYQQYIYGVMREKVELRIKGSNYICIFSCGSLAIPYSDIE